MPQQIVKLVEISYQKGCIFKDNRKFIENENSTKISKY